MIFCVKHQQLSCSVMLCVCRGIYLAAVFYHKDSLLVTAEDQIPIVEVDDSYSSSLMQDFLWFTKVKASQHCSQTNTHVKFYVFTTQHITCPTKELKVTQQRKKEVKRKQLLKVRLLTTTDT